MKLKPKPKDHRVLHCSAARQATTEANAEREVMETYVP